MKSKRSMWKLVLGVASVGLLVTNCTIKTDDGAENTLSGNCSPVGKKFSGCTCPGNLKSYQLCTEDGTYGACVCEDTGNGGASSDGGASSKAGASSKGGASSYAGSSSYAGLAGAATEGGSAGADSTEGGAAGATGLVIDPADCPSCLAQLCADEWDACADDNETTTVDLNGAYCLSQGTNAAPGQIELILDCINTERSKGLVKRDAVRACGSSIGQSADPSFFQWAPVGMTPATENLMNCMADAPDETMPGDWATDTATNFPASGPRPWDDMTCAKLACTSKLP